MDWLSFYDKLIVKRIRNGQVLANNGQIIDEKYLDQFWCWAAKGFRSPLVGKLRYVFEIDTYTDTRTMIRFHFIIA